ncbi:hypothetical protein Scep_009998 [Stephania cephalantha]|uniref:Uncharacterized protein n=1 Tax=Stephania cephalantha TaxID=152367 RepID=A0AAP0PDN2_9MAGN
MKRRLAREQTSGSEQRPMSRGAGEEERDGQATHSSSSAAMRARRGNGSDRQCDEQRRRDATRRTHCGGGGRQAASPATGERRRGFDAMNGAVARCQPVGCAISTKSRRRGEAIVEIVVDRVGPMASESQLLFICDMSLYPDAVDISQLSVRWGHLSGP